MRYSDENGGVRKNRPALSAERRSRAPAERPNDAPAARQGRPARSGAPLSVRRESLAPAARTGDENIIRVRTGADRVMLALILILLALGSIMVFSASYPSALAKEGDSMYYIKRQVLFAAAGLIVMFIASWVPPAVYKKLAIPAFGVAVVLLLLVFVPGIGLMKGEARRWIWIRGTSFTFQPSEAMKVALVMVLAWYVDRYRDAVLERRNKKNCIVRGTLLPCLFILCACFLVLIEKHLSGTAIIGMLGACVLFIGGVHLGWMAAILGGAGLLGCGVFLLKNPYALKRLTTFTDDNADKLNELWQTTQGLYAIGSGGPLGVGLGASRQKYSYVSEAQNDFIFTIWCEELGFVGALALIAVFLLFIWRGYVIAMRAPDTFSALLVFGIVTQVGLQAFLNMAVVTDILPNTGISLPFFSYGGTSLIILLAEMGVVLSVSRHSYQKR